MYGSFAPKGEVPDSCWAVSEPSYWTLPDGVERLGQEVPLILGSVMIPL